MTGRRWHSRATIAALTACAVIGAAVAGCGGGGSDHGTSAAATVDERSATTVPEETSGPTRALLRPIGDTKASGTVSFSRPPESAALIRIRLAGLEPTSGKQAYVVWLRGSRHDMLVIASYRAGKEGRVDAQKVFEEPFLFLEDGSKTEVLVSRVNDRRKWWEGRVAGSPGGWDPLIVGQRVLEAPITGSLVGANAEAAG